MRYKSIILLTALLSMRLIGVAQNVGIIKDDIDVTNFPEISFVYHNNNPQKLSKSDFDFVKESGHVTNFNITSLPQSRSIQTQNTIILWEDMAHNGYGQFNFTKEVLDGFFNNAELSDSDNFGIYEFNRRGNEESALKSLTSGLTNDKLKLVSSVRNNKLSSVHYPEFPNRSDVYTAIREAINILSPLSGTKSIIVFTAGYPMTNSGSDSEPQVLILSQQQHVPVYIFQYYYRSGVASATEGFAESTFGAFNSYKDSNSAKSDLIALYPQMKQRYLGQDYKISFTSSAKRGDGSQSIALKVKGVELLSSYLPPEFSLWIWIEENVILSVITLLIILTLIGVIIYYVVKRSKRAEVSTDVDDITTTPPQSPQSGTIPFPIHPTDRQNRTEVDDTKDMIDWMRLKNINPRLDYRTKQSREIFNINKTRVTIGRSDDNNLVLAYNTVSHHHAEIVFANNRGFEIVDQGSTNKIYINGQVAERAVLKSGDVIKLGEVVVMFYM